MQKEVEEKQKRVSELIRLAQELARSRAQALDGEDARSARKCLVEAEQSAEYSRQWREVSGVWKKELDDDREARRCLKRAEQTADDPQDLCFAAGAWMELFGSEDEARRCLAEAEADQISCLWRPDPIQWFDIAKAWKHLFEDNSKALLSPAIAEETAEYPIDWCLIVRVWMELFGDEREARRCLSQAEHEVEDPPDWRRIAEAWKTLGDEGKPAAVLQPRSSHSLESWTIGRAPAGCGGNTYTAMNTPASACSKRNSWRNTHPILLGLPGHGGAFLATTPGLNVAWLKLSNWLRMCLTGWLSPRSGWRFSAKRQKPANVLTAQRQELRVRLIESG